MARKRSHWRQIYHGHYSWRVPQGVWSAARSTNDPGHWWLTFDGATIGRFTTATAAKQAAERDQRKVPHR